MENTGTTNKTINKSHISSYFNNFKDKERQKVIMYLYVIFTLFAISFLSLFAIGPTLSTIFSLQKQYEDNKEIELLLKNKIDALNKLNAEYQQISPLLNLMYTAFPKSSNAPYLTRQLQMIVEQNGFSLKSLGNGKFELYPLVVSETGNYSYNFNIVATGDEANLNKLILDIINFDRIVNLESVNISKDENDSLEVKISGNVYFSK